jgi:peroxiredoxin
VPDTIVSAPAPARPAVAGKIGVTLLCCYLFAVTLRLGSCYQPEARVRDERAAAGPQVGAPFPSFELPDVSGARVTSGDLAGHPALLLFVPSLDWSPPTKARLLDLVPALGQARDLAVAVVLSRAQATPRALTFVHEHAAPFYYLIDDRGLAETLGLGVDAPDGSRTTLSATFVLDARGAVVLRDVRHDPRVWLAPEAIVAAIRRPPGA